MRVAEVFASGVNPAGRDGWYDHDHDWDDRWDWHWHRHGHWDQWHHWCWDD